MDEPTAALTEREVESLFEVIRRLRDDRRRHRLHLSPARGSLRHRGPDHRAQGRGDRRNGRRRQRHPVRADSDDGRPGADNRLPKARRSSWGGRPRIARRLERRGGCARRLADCAPGGDPGPRRVWSARAARNSPKRCSASRPPTTGAIIVDGTPVRISSPQDAIDAGIALRAGRPPASRRGSGDVRRGERQPGKPAAGSRGADCSIARRKTDRPAITSNRLRIKTAIRARGRRHAVGRQSAEGGSRALADDGAGGPHPRRADAGRRRRVEGRNSRADAGTGRTRPRHHHDFFRAARRFSG